MMSRPREPHPTALRLGPSEDRGGDLLRMAHPGGGPEPWRHMPAHQSPVAQPTHSGSDRRRDIVRLLVIALCIIALVLTSSALNWVTEARAASDQPAGPRKAVVVAGPVHGLTDRYRAYAKAIADAAQAEGMVVKRIFHPKATAHRVKKHANGADLFVYVGHGNGWPSPFPPFQERTKNGLGLNPPDIEQATTANVKYKGADWLRANIRLAPNAVVILSHLSYASGNASTGMPLPTREIAIERVDNFANGFLSSGARVVWALGWQPGADVVQALHREDATMDAVFMTRYRAGVNPLNGWIGHDPGYYPSVRIPGATVLIDPDPAYGFLRGITGDLAFTTTEWRNPGVVPPDVDPPVISDVSARQAAVTLATTDASVPVFTPNGDGISDTIGISYSLSENAFVEMRVMKSGTLVRTTTTWALRGSGSLVWDGRRDDGRLVGEGQFRIILTPTDRAGNRGQSAAVKVKVLNSLKNPTANPALFYPSDGDSLAQTSVLKARITREAAASWTIRDAAGNVVRRVVDDARAAGDFRFVWDGTDDSGAYVPDGPYRARVRVTRPQGTYAHEVTVRVMPFSLWTKSWQLRRGDRIVLQLTSAEPLKGKPIIFANQPGIKKYTVPKDKIRKLSDTRFDVTLQTRAKGAAGPMKVRVIGTDTGGGSQAKVFTLTLR